MAKRIRNPHRARYGKCDAFPTCTGALAFITSPVLKREPYLTGRQMTTPSPSIRWLAHCRYRL